MDYYDKEFCLEVWGPMACFTRPELKVERVSYDVITPSAARSIFEAIFWKPAIRWEITKIEVLNPIKWTSVRRNEVGAVASVADLKPIYIESARQQKNSLLLKDVHYRIYAKLVFIPMRKRVEDNGAYRAWYNSSSDSYSKTKNPVVDSEEQTLIRKDENPGKYNAMFERRASKGQCFNQPYLGSREFSASFRLVSPEEKDLKPAIQESRDLGIMLFDMDFSKDKDHPQAMFFRAQMNQGVINVPSIDSGEVLR